MGPIINNSQREGRKMWGVGAWFFFYFWEGGAFRYFTVRAGALKIYLNQRRVVVVGVGGGGGERGGLENIMQFKYIILVFNFIKFNF